MKGKRKKEVEFSLAFRKHPNKSREGDIKIILTILARPNRQMMTSPLVIYQPFKLGEVSLLILIIFNNIILNKINFCDFL